MNPYLIPGLTLSPAVYRRMYELIPAARLDEPTAEGRFTPREVIAHVADWEPIFTERIKLALENDHPTLVPYDESELAEKNNYRAASVQEMLGRLERDRQVNIALLKSLSPEQLERTCFHPERGEMRVEHIFSMMVGHDMYHLEQLTQSVGEKQTGTW